jgi:hypothetical protein
MLRRMFGPKGKKEALLKTGFIKLGPRGRVLLEKLIVIQVMKKFSALYGNRRFIAVFTRACH